MRMKWTLVLAVAALLLGGATIASAQLRIDANIDVPFYLGAASGGVQLAGQAIPAFIPFPNVDLLLQLGIGPIHIGGGGRVFTWILQSVIYPELFAELQLGKLVINANIGGGAYFTFGLLSYLAKQADPTFPMYAFGPVFMPDISVGYELTNWFRIRVGVFMFTHRDIPNSFIFAPYVGGKFVAKF